MAEETKDPRAVELGRRGGLARRNRQSADERKAVARLGGIARAAKAALRREQESLLPTTVTELVPVTYEITPWKALRGVKADDAQEYIDERWTPRLIQFFEQLMQAYTKAGNLDAALKVAMIMAGITSTLSPARLRKQAEKYVSQEPDLSHLTDEQLSAITAILGKPLSASAATATERWVAQERGPDDLNDDRAAPSAPDDRGVESPVSFGDSRQSINARDSGPVGGPSAPSKLSCDDAPALEASFGRVGKLSCHDAPALKRILDISRTSYARRS